MAMSGRDAVMPLSDLRLPALPGPRLDVSVCDIKAAPSEPLHV
jgi:hypothetical protein